MRAAFAFELSKQFNHRRATESAMNSFTSLVFNRSTRQSALSIQLFLKFLAQQGNLITRAGNQSKIPKTIKNIFRFHKAARIFLSFGVMLALSGCGVFQHKVDLKKIPVVSIEATQANGPGIAPGDKSPLVVTVTQPDGKKLTTEGKGKGPVRWRDLAVTSTVAAANNKGVLTLSKDPRESEGKLPHVTIAVPSHPDVKPVNLDIPLRYDRDFKIGFAGPSGRSGWDGQDGTDGSNGSTGSIDPDHPSPGGDGTNGGNGTDGGNGDDGGDGPPVRVVVAIYYPPVQVASASAAGTTMAASSPLLQVSVSSGKTEQFFLVDPKGGSLTITSAGGSGGSGGRGGRGGRGGTGGSGIPSGRDGMNGSDGQSGFSGHDGKGGPIYVTYDPRAKPYLGAIQLRNPGGPAPVLNEMTVAPLW
jgi:hypothetical protein